MPYVYLDAEAAAMVELSCVMLETALKTRVARVDPDGIISNSLILQARKLETFRAMAKAPEPPKFTQMPEPIRRKALATATMLQGETDPEEKNRLWEQLRGLLIAAPIPEFDPARRLDVSQISPGNAGAKPSL